MALLVLLLVIRALVTLAIPAETQIDAPIVSSNELKGPCRPITFIFARGTTEPGNIGIIAGPGVSCNLKWKYGARNVATQGVDYSATYAGNYRPLGCEDAGVAAFKADIVEAAKKCPTTKIVAGGFSQGTACLHAAFRELDAETLKRVAGVVTFGDTRNKEDHGRVPNFPADKTKIFCAKGDEVCNGLLKTSSAHRSYWKDTGEAARFLAEKIGPIKGGKEKKGKGRGMDRC